MHADVPGSCPAAPKGLPRPRGVPIRAGEWLRTLSGPIHGRAGLFTAVLTAHRCERTERPELTVPIVTTALGHGAPPWGTAWEQLARALVVFGATLNLGPLAAPQLGPKSEHTGPGWIR